ncbi:MAG: hypothetical protein AAF409_13400 [Pseudomonadota bacterium]
MSHKRRSFGDDKPPASTLADLSLLQTEEERRRSADLARYGCTGVSETREDAGITARSVKLTTGGGVWSLLLGVKR